MLSREERGRIWMFYDGFPSRVDLIIIFDFYLVFKNQMGVVEASNKSAVAIFIAFCEEFAIYT